MARLKNGTRDLTQGPLAKQILLFSLPLMATSLLQVLFNMADLAVVGRFAGPMPLGSVGSTAQMVFLFTGLQIGLGGGVNVLVARYFGARQREELSRTVHTAFFICLAMGLLLMVGGWLLSPWILKLLNTKPELIDGAVLYLRLYVLGMPAMGLYNFGNAVFSAVGDTRRPLIYLSLAGGLNVVLNLLFVIGFGMDVDGVGLASALSQYISAVLILRALLRTREDFGLRPRELRLHWASAGQILAIGIPAGLQNVIFAIANMFIQSSLNTFSAITVAGAAAAANADALTYDGIVGFYTACGSFVGQNFGAGKKRRIRRSYFLCLGYSFGITLLMGIALLIWGREFLFIFTDDPLVVEAGLERLKILALSYPVACFMDCSIAACRGLGKSFVPMVMVILGSCVFRIAWVYTVFAHFRTIPSLYLLYAFSWSITAVAIIWYFVRVYRRETKDLTE